MDTQRIHNQTGWSIEQGHFVLTMMPSLYCDMKCPHCYLTKADRADRTRLSEADIDTLMGRVASYYRSTGINQKTIHAYQYGGEPTSMGIGPFHAMLDVLDGHFTSSEGYHLQHTILTSFINVDLNVWERLIFERCGGYVQSSYDGRMRGGAYMREWERTMREAHARGMTLGTISVVNERLLEEGPEKVLDYLVDLHVKDASFLPFILNDTNEGKPYEKLAPTMNAWSDFMIAITKAWVERKKKGVDVPEIGQLRFILGQQDSGSPVSNIAGQTLFLLPNGDYALPDYTQGWKEYLNRFANGLHHDFEDVLRSPKRKAYLRKQLFKNNNPDCLSCPHGGHCVMEFWKRNNPDDDCFGGRRYVDWIVRNRAFVEQVMPSRKTLSLY